MNHELRAAQTGGRLTDVSGGDLVSTEVVGEDKRAEVPSSLVNPLGNKTKCRLFICTGCLTKGSSSAPGLLVGPETGADSNKLA